MTTSESTSTPVTGSDIPARTPPRVAGEPQPQPRRQRRVRVDPRLVKARKHVEEAKYHLERMRDTQPAHDPTLVFANYNHIGAQHHVEAVLAAQKLRARCPRYVPFRDKIQVGNILETQPTLYGNVTYFAVTKLQPLEAKCIAMGCIKDDLHLVKRQHVFRPAPTHSPLQVMWLRKEPECFLNYNNETVCTTPRDAIRSPWDTEAAYHAMGVMGP